MRVADTSPPDITIFYIAASRQFGLFYNYLINEIGEVNKDKFGESTENILVVTIIPLLTGFPVMESYLQIVATFNLRQGDTAFLCPLAFRKNQSLIGTICLNALPGGNAYAIAIYLIGYSAKYLVL